MAAFLVILAPFLVQPDQILRLTPQVSEESSWSPDGKWISFDRALERSCEIVRIPAP